MYLEQVLPPPISWPRVQIRIRIFFNEKILHIYSSYGGDCCHNVWLVVMSTILFHLQQVRAALVLFMMNRHQYKLYTCFCYFNPSGWVTCYYSGWLMWFVSYIIYICFVLHHVCDECVFIRRWLTLLCSIKWAVYQHSVQIFGLMCWISFLHMSESLSCKSKITQRPELRF